MNFFPNTLHTNYLKVDLNAENLVYVMSETINLLQESPAKKHSVHSKESKLKQVSDLLLKALNMGLSHKESVSSLFFQ